MSGVFVSYSRVDRAFAHRIVVGLRRLGVDVWWDEDMPGVDWQLELQRKIQELGAVVVLWSPSSLESKNVRDEARLGLGAEKLVNILAGVAEPPFPFDRVNGLDLTGWAGAEATPGWMRLIRTLEPLLAAGGAPPLALAAAQEARDQQIRDLRASLADAQSAFSTAQARAREAAEDEQEEAGALRRVEKRLQAALEARAPASIAEAAQRDLDAARLRRDRSEEAHAAARDELTAASKALGAAKAGLDRLLETEPAAVHGGRSERPAPGSARPSRGSRPDDAWRDLAEEASRRGIEVAEKAVRRGGKRWADLEARKARRARNRPVIGLGGLIFLSVVALVIWNQASRPKRAAKHDVVLASTLSHLPCAWLDANPSTVDGRSGLVVTGAAGDPSAAASAVSALAVADGVPLGATNTDGIRHFDKRLCDAVTVLNERRPSHSSSGPRLEVAPGAAGGRTAVTLTTGDEDNDFVLLALKSDGAVEPVALSAGAIADRAGLKAASANPDVTAIGEGVWRLMLPGGQGARGLALITGDGPFSPAIVGGPPAQRGDEWQRRFRTAAAEGGWRTAMAWFKSD